MFRKKKREKKKKGYLKEMQEMYAEIWCTLLVEGRSRYREKHREKKGEIGVDLMGTYAGLSSANYYILEKLPADIPLEYKERIRDEAIEVSQQLESKEVLVHFVDNIQRHEINWEAPQMKSKLRILREVKEDQENKGYDAYNAHETIGATTRQEWIEKSLYYYAEAEKRRGREMLKYESVMIVTGEQGEAFDVASERLEMLMQNTLGIRYRRVYFEVTKMLEYISPFRQERQKEHIGKVPMFVLPDETVSRFNVYEQGRLGDKGVYFGTDIDSLNPVLKRVKQKGTEAENWLIAAETDGGKSFFVACLLIQLLDLSYNGTIMDIEGFEYQAIAEYAKSAGKEVEVLDLSVGYLDPLEIMECIGDPEYDKGLKKMAVDFTLAKLRILIGAMWEEDVWVETVVLDAIQHAYADYGVTELEETWEKSQGMSLLDVFSAIETICDTTGEARGYQMAAEKLGVVLRKYFEETGLLSGLFSSKTSMQKILDAELVVCAFGMAGKSETLIEGVEMNLMQLDAAQICYQRTLKSRQAKKFNFKLWEEFQRWGKFEGSDKLVNVALTGGRKVGDVNMIVTNQLDALLKEDKYGVFENTTSFMIGKIVKEETRKKFCTELSMPLLLSELNKIATTSKKGNNDYRYSFLCNLDRDDIAVVKMCIPEELEKSKMFYKGIKR